MNLAGLYKTRFNELEKRNSLWQVLCQDFFQKYIDKNDTVIDIAAGYCEFINNIKAKEKIAFDLNPEAKNFANSDVEFLNQSCELIDKFIDPDSADVVFISNFFEHLDKKEQIVQILNKLYKILRNGGKVLILQPNIKLVKEAYWDFIDHKLALTDKAIIEAGEMNGFKLKKNIYRFLPYTTKSKISQSPILVKLYLKLLPASALFMGKQSFIILEKQNG